MLAWMAKTDIGHVIIALGAGLDGKAIGRVTKLRAAAAAVVYHRHPDSVILFSGGHTSGVGTISEAEAMREYFLAHRRFPVPRTKMLTETESPDTATNVRNIAAMLRTLPLAPGVRITLIAGRRQMEGAVAYFHSMGFTVRPLLVRQALGAIARCYMIPPGVDAPPTEHERMRGALWRALRVVDSRGYLASVIMRWRRRR